MKLVLLIGYFGARNFGDDWTLASFLQGVKGWESSLLWTVVSRSPSETVRQFKVNAVPRIGRLFWKAFRQAHSVIALGGSLLQDVTSFRSLLYYASLLTFAKRFGKKVILLGQGLGPLKRSASRCLAHGALRNADLITFRDSQSFSYGASMQVGAGSAHLTADITFAYQGEPPVEKENLLTVNLRQWSGLTEAVTVALSRPIKEIAQKFGLRVTTLVLQQGWDQAPSQVLASCIKSSVRQPTEWWEKLSFLQRSRAVVAMRLHGLIGALMGGTLAVGLVYDPKVSAILSPVLNSYLCPMPPDPCALKVALEKGLSEWGQGVPERVIHLLETQKRAAQLNFELLRSVL
ncbi:MAG: polysaccharide pyruvyl transferase CsaB [Armatimonadetes bacterium]|nr:polysaccharide pyruvyl transferase CsaB [Armatimonadota bacterium]MDW8122160.1 polysaccharide pyruvyl transferase CsaB [Armatimonadota bacterium]